MIASLKTFCRRTYNQIRYLPYRGRGFTCNACNATYSRFVSWLPNKTEAEALRRNNVVAGYGTNNICPNCLSSCRERLVLAALQFLFKPKSKKVLHLAPEAPIYSFLNSHNWVIAGDPAPNCYTGFAGSFVALDALHLPFATDTFELLIANHVLEHILKDHLAMEEFYRVLAPKGVAILQVPFSRSIVTTLEVESAVTDSDRARLYGQKDHVRIYKLDEYTKRLTHAGFKVKTYEQYELKLAANFAFQEGEVLITASKGD